MKIQSATIRRYWRQFGQDAIDFVYSRSCVRCRAIRPCPEEGFVCSDEGITHLTPFCQSCFELLSCSVEHFCRRCGAPIGPYLDSENGCRHCRSETFQFDRVFALGRYEHVLRECCIRAKQSFEEPLTAGLADLLWDAHQETLRNLEIDLVLPVPHHWTERLTRRHFPPETMSRVLSRRLMAPQTLHILTKSKRTEAQSSLTPTRRRANLRKAFRIVGGARLQGRTILVTDDILTTGTTADRVASVLRGAGAAKVIVAVLARGIGQSAKS